MSIMIKSLRIVSVCDIHNLAGWLALCCVGLCIALPEAYGEQEQSGPDSPTKLDESQRASECALSAFRKLGGVAQWVDRKNKHLMIRRFNVKELNVSLSQLRILSEVKLLTLHGFDFGDDDLKAVSKWIHLEGLQLIYNRDVSDNGIKYLEHMDRLKRLVLWDTKMTSAGMKHISLLSNLEYLEIQNSLVGDAGLAMLNSNKKLAIIKLYGTNATRAGTDRLKRSLPNCAIDTD